MTDAPKRRRGRLLAVIGALGLTSAVGGFGVNELLSSAKHKLEDRGPLIISVREDPQGANDGFRVASAPRADLSATLRNAKGCNPLLRASKRIGAVDVRREELQLILEGNRKSVSIVALHAHVVRRGPPIASNAIGCTGAGEEDSVPIAFDLDEPDPTARKMARSAPLPRVGAPYFENGRIVSLTDGETQPFMIVAMSKSHLIEWDLEATAIVDGHEQTLTLNNHGRHLAVTAPPPRGEYARYYEVLWFDQNRLYVGSRPYK